MDKTHMDRTDVDVTDTNNAENGNCDSTDPRISLTPVTVQLVGQDGNAFAIIGRVSGALRRGGYRHLVDQFQAEATAGDYNHLLQVCRKYVNVE